MHEAVEKTNELRLDASGGATLWGECGNAAGGTRLVLREPRLKALDLRQAASLEVLDLRGCGGPTFHLALDELPRLREVYLPHGDEGGVIHLAASSLPVSLRVHGPVAEFDADWQAGSCRQVASPRPWQGLRLMGRDATPSDIGLDARREEAGEALKVVLASEPLPPRLTLTEPGDWLLVAPRGLERLTLDGPRRVTLTGAHRLTYLETVTPADVQADGLEALTRVVGASASEDVAAAMPVRGQLVLKGTLEALDIAGAWTGVQVHSRTLIRLSVAQADVLALHHCRRLDRIALPDGIEIDCHGSVPSALLGEARFHVNEATLRQTLERLQAGDTEALSTLLALLPLRASPYSALHGLLVLERLCDMGLDPQAIWECRRALSAHHLHGKRRRRTASARALARADLNWQWELPRDRAEEGMDADLRIWCYCQTHSEPAYAYRDTLLGTCGKSLDALRCLLRGALQPGVAPALRGLMLEAMARFYGVPGARPRLGGGSTGAVRKAVALFRREALGDEAARTVLLFIVHETAWERLPRLIPTLMRVRAGLVRDVLMTLSRRPDEWFQRRLPDRFVSERAVHDARLRLTQLALMPAWPVADDLPSCEEMLS